MSRITRSKRPVGCSVRLARRIQNACAATSSSMVPQSLAPPSAMQSSASPRRIAPNSSSRLGADVQHSTLGRDLGQQASRHTSTHVPGTGAG
jgi:hypothetical protein